jgi:hypothetical protein
MQYFVLTFSGSQGAFPVHKLDIIDLVHVKYWTKNLTMPG